jgi:mannose-1-phosphate guanylyltransferase
VLELIDADRPVSIERETFPSLVGQGTLFAMPADVYWIDTGRPEQYLQANLDVLDGLRPEVTVPPAIDPRACVADDAVVERSVVGADVVIGPRATVRDSVVLPGAVVEAGATMTSCVVMGRVGPRATLVDVVVGAHGVVDDGAAMEGVRIPGEG